MANIEFIKDNPRYLEILDDAELIKILLNRKINLKDVLLPDVAKKLTISNIALLLDKVRKTSSYDSVESLSQSDNFKRGLVQFGTTIKKGDFIEFLNNLSKEFIETYINEVSEVIYGEDVLKSIDDINLLLEDYNQIRNSKAKELQNHANFVIELLVNDSYSKEKIKNIEQEFLKDDIPFVGKIYMTFKIMFPNFSGLNFSNESKMSPTLKRKGNRGREAIIFSDLLKSALGSNNNSLKKYIKDIEDGYNVFSMLVNDSCSYDDLDNDSKESISIFCKHLCSLYNFTFKGINQNELLILSGDISNDLVLLRSIYAPNGELDYDLPDRIVKMFCHFAGFDTLNSLKSYMEEKVAYADAKNRIKSQQSMVLEKGDLLKGIGNVEYLYYLLQNGILSNEYLGANAKSNRTPLDTDFSRIEEPKATLKENIYSSTSAQFGPIWLVLKGDDRFVVTRDSDDQEIEINDSGKLEIFCIDATSTKNSSHYGLRTGFASSEIDYMIVNEGADLSELKQEIVINGFYIPIVDMEGRIIFTPKEFDELMDLINSNTQNILKR